MTLLSRLAILVGSLTLALLVIAPPAVAEDGGHREVVRLREVLRDIVSELALLNTMDKKGVAELRDELSQVYRDLDALADRLEYGAADGLPDFDTWQPYADCSIKRRPQDAKFDRWYKDAKVDMLWGEYGELILKVENGYTAECSIRQAYSGAVQASLRTEAEGDVVIKVQDDIGSHEFKVANGGLGPVAVRGRDGVLPGKQTQPIGLNNAEDRGIPPWYAAYNELVQAGQLGNSPGVEWLRAQYDLGDYESYTLERLGDRLANLPAQTSDVPVGRLMYRRNGEYEELDIPDPRFNPAGFAHVIGKLYNIVLDGKSYDLEF